METQFVNHLMGEMRKTINKEDPDSSQMNYYNSLMDYELSKIMAKNDKGIGIKEMILEDIVPEHIKQRMRQIPAKNSAYNSHGGEKK